MLYKVLIHARRKWDEVSIVGAKEWRVKDMGFEPDMPRVSVPNPGD